MIEMFVQNKFMIFYDSQSFISFKICNHLIIVIIWDIYSLEIFIDNLKQAPINSLEMIFSKTLLLKKQLRNI